MPIETNKAFTDWKSAEAAAREAERRLSTAWEHFERSRGEPPGADLLAEVSRRRTVANERLTAAIRILDATAPR
jgi:ferric-dicitrate binding protein FerR (iron transport regulator)